jgi:nucleoside-diphosphate-sugar epimerase
MKKVLIVGGNGFVGRNLAEKLLVSENELFLMDNLLSSDEDLVPINPKVSFIKADAGKIESFDELPNDIDTIFLLHCFHGNQSSLYDPLKDLENTLRPTIATYEWVRKKEQRPIIVYAGAGCSVAAKTWDSPEPVTETDFIHMGHDSPYSISKLAGEMHSIMYSENFGLNIRRARFQNVFGPGEFLGAGQWRGTPATIWRNVIPTFIWKALNNEDIVITGGNASRDFIYVEDISQGLIAVANKGIMGNAYNIASGIETSITNLAEMIVQMSDSKSKIVTTHRRAWDNSGRRYGSTLKSRQELDYSAKTDIKNGLLETISWTVENYEIISKKIDSHKGH